MTDISDTGVSDGMLNTETVDEAGGVEDTGTAVLAAWWRAAQRQFLSLSAAM